jgi:hypothetical protein
MDILIWAIVSIVAILVMTVLSSALLSDLCDRDSKVDDRWQEYHVGAVAANTFVVGGLLWLFCKISLASVLILPLLVVLSWCGSLLVKQPETTHHWDEVSIRRLALCLLFSVLATYVIGSLLGITPGMGPLYMGLIYAACWMLLSQV